MRCSKCLFQIAGDKAPRIRHCITCGSQLVPSVEDVLEYNCFGLVNEVRPEQVRMAADIESLLQHETGTLLAEGGTGLGKSYAYVTPALTRMIEQQHTEQPLVNPFRVVIATAKKSLQAQLYNDLPRLCNILGVPENTSTVLYKGLNNYACWKLAGTVPENERDTFKKFIDSAAAAQQPADIVDWPGPRPVWWDTINLENCPLGVSCENYKNCRPRVKDASIVITNQHLLGLDLSLFQPGWLFGPYNLLVVDEAHHLAKALRDLLSKTLRPEILMTASKRLLGDPWLHDMISETGGGRLSATALGTGIEKTYNSLNTLLRKAASGADATHRYRATHFTEDFKTCQTLLDLPLISLNLIHDELVKNHEFVKSAGEHDGHDAGYYLSMLNKLSRVIKPLNNAKAFLEKHIDHEIIQQHITVAATTPEDSSFYMTPISIGPTIGPILDSIQHKVFVSATLSLSGDFSYFQEDLGISGSTGKVYKSPYDITKNVALYLPPWDMPQPSHGFSAGRPEWISKISEEIRKLCNLTRGGTFVLFSAEKDMREVEDHIGPTLKADGLTLIVQRGEVTQHIDNFRKSSRGVLFGLKSVWEGIDIAGDSLRCVIIPKLPFPNPADPVIASHSELVTAQGGNAFARVSLPAMFNDMRQGSGRLIRSATDKGIVAILDIRIWTGGGKEHARKLAKVINDPGHKRLGYGKELLDILSFTNITNDFTCLGMWYKKMFTALNTANPVKEGEQKNGTSKR